MNIKNVILTISIAIILVMFLNYGFDTFKKQPQYDDYCNETMRFKAVPLEKADRNITEQERIDAEKLNEYYQKCNKDYELAREKYERPRFIFLSITGLIAILIGGIMIKIEGIGIGIFGGGVISVISGTAGYWRHLSNSIKFLMLGIVLCVLIWVGVNISQRESNVKRRRKR